MFASCALLFGLAVGAGEPPPVTVGARLVLHDTTARITYEVDEKTKQIVSRREGSRHRFTCIPVNMDTLVANQGAAKGKDEPTPSGSGPDTKTGDEALEAAAA